MRTHTRSRAVFAAASAFALAVSVSACATTDDSASQAASSASSAVGSAAESATSAVDGATADDESSVIEFSDGWAKASDSDMTGVFGMIRNTGSEEVTLTSVSGDIGARQELHETVPGASGIQMREKEGGFVIPAGGELEFAPGGNHIMLMELGEPITTGQEVTLTLEFASGETQEITVSARSFEGGEEDYVGGGQGAMNQGAKNQGAMNQGAENRGGMNDDG